MSSHTMATILPRDARVRMVFAINIQAIRAREVKKMSRICNSSIVRICGKGSTKEKSSVNAAGTSSMRLILRIDTGLDQNAVSISTYLIPKLVGKQHVSTECFQRGK